MFYVFEGVEGLQGQQTHKTCPDGAFYMYEGEGMGQRVDEHIKHARLGVFYRWACFTCTYEGEGWVRRDEHIKHAVFYVEGQRGGKHVKHAQTGVFYVLEGQRGSEHVKHAQMGMFYIVIESHVRLPIKVSVTNRKFTLFNCPLLWHNFFYFCNSFSGSKANQKRQITGLSITSFMCMRGRRWVRGGTNT